MRNATAWKRLKGRWVLRARHWKGYHVYYRGKSIPPRTIKFANTFADESEAKKVVHFMRKNGARLNWYPVKAKETEVFRDLLRFV